MANCEWCGRYFPDGKGYTGGPQWNRRYYCSKKCALEGENNLTSADEAEDNLTSADEAEDNLSFAQRAGRFIKNLIITVTIILAIFIIIGILS